ncbi:MAG: hypothetical protein ACR2HA_00600 [Nocardioides sp.]
MTDRDDVRRNLSRRREDELLAIMRAAQLAAEAHHRSSPSGAALTRRALELALHALGLRMPDGAPRKMD